MANDSNTIKLALGLALLVAGGFLFWWGHSGLLSGGGSAAGSEVSEWAVSPF
jgi:hypothetical protein